MLEKRFETHFDSVACQNYPLLNFFLVYQVDKEGIEHRK